MARARWLKPEFFTDSKVSQLSDQAALLFAAIWTECDDGGVCPGNPQVIYGRRFITRRRWTARTVKLALEELSQAGLVRPFVHRGEPFLLIPGFADKQGIKPKDWRHLGREHASIIKRVLDAPAVPTDSNPVPTESNEVLLPLTPKPIAVAVAGAVAVAKAVAVAEAGYGADFERVWAAYPKRSGGNPKRSAYHAWSARLAEGVTVEALEAGVSRYAAFIATTGRTNTQYVKQAATFFGPDRHFEELWAPPAGSGNGTSIPEPGDDEDPDVYARRLQVHMMNRRG